VFSHRWFTVHAIDCARLFGIPPPVCERILRELEEVGIVKQPRPGIWTRAFGH
jgi:hypothetical protein